MRFAASFLALALFASCDKPETAEPDPDVPGTEDPDVPSYPENANTFVVDGEESPVGSTFAFTEEGSVTFIATPNKTTSEEAFDGKYIQMQVPADLYNQDIDLKENNIKTYGNNGTGTSEITSDMLESGSARLNHEDGTDTYTLLAYMKFNDGTEVGINATATAEEEETPGGSSTITVNNTTNPIMAAFYADEETDGMSLTCLYFTTSDIDYFDEMANASEYIYLVIDQDAMTGNEFDISNPDKYFYIMYCNTDPNSYNFQDATTGSLKGATGTMSVARDGLDPTEFTADISIRFGNETSVSISFDGVCKSTYEVSQTYANPGL